MRELKRKKLWWTLAWGLLALVFMLSLIPMPAPPIDLPQGFDKYEHILAYGTLSSYFGQLCGRTKQHLRYAFGLFCMGALLEVLQGLTWYRSPDLSDLAANTMGVLAGLLLCLTPLRSIVARLDARF
jgi:VanZ family protein